MNLKFVLLILSNDIKGPTKLEVNHTQIEHFSLKKTQKWLYLKIPFFPSVNHQKAYFSYMNFSEIFRIDVISQIMNDLYC